MVRVTGLLLWRPRVNTGNWNGVAGIECQKCKKVDYALNRHNGICSSCAIQEILEEAEQEREGRTYEEGYQYGLAAMGKKWIITEEWKQGYEDGVGDRERIQRG